MDFIGVDGCKKGWFAVTLDSEGSWQIYLYKTIANLWNSSNLVRNAIR